MSGPNPPGPEPEHPGPGSDFGHESDFVHQLEPYEASAEHQIVAPADATGETEAYSQAYSAPEAEHFTSGPYVPPDLRLYDYDVYGEPSDGDGGHAGARWPWLVGVVAIVAAVALVVSVSLLFTRTQTDNLANPGPSTTTPSPPMQDEITTTKPPPPPPPTSEPPTPTETQTVTVTTPPPPAPTTPPPPPVAPPTSAALPPPTPTAPAGPRQVTYSVTGTKAPGDIISITYVDASGRRRTQHNVYIPWSMTVTPISTSDVGSVEAFSLFHISRLNCSITTSDGTVLSSNSGDAPQTSC